MKNMKVSMKLIVSFLIVAILTGVVGVAGIIGLNMLNRNEEGMYKQSVTANNAAMALRNIQAQRAACRGAAIKQVLGMEYEAEFTSLTDLNAEFDGYVTALGNALTLQENKDRLADANKSYAEYVTLRDPFIDAVRRNDNVTLTEVMKQIGAPLDIVVKDLTAISESALLVVGERNINDGKTANSLITLMIAIVIISVGVAIFFAVYISSLISKPLRALTSFMNQAGQTGNITLRPEDVENISKFAQNKDEIGQCISSTANFVKHITDVANGLETIANGDLTVELTLLSENDTMGVSLRKMVENLNHMFAEINSASAQVTIGSKQISDGAQTLAQGSTEQASAVQQLSASISEIAEKTKENAKMANHAADLAQTIMGNAEKGSRQMDQMMEAVKEINTASHSISKVIKVIDDIAFQTNILALNAAVEAARAGQHGKGFAVVAEEVRSLAAKSAEAAKETGGLIANSMEKAELGSRIASETAGSLSDIVSGINESNKIVGDIAKSSEEQSQAIGQVNTGIDQVAQVVQQNSATAEQSAAASEEMSGQSHALENLIAQFKLKNAGGADYGISSGAQQRLVLPSQAYESRNDGFGKY